MNTHGDIDLDIGLFAFRAKNVAVHCALFNREPNISLCVEMCLLDNSKANS
jgi:hypothetical protein